MARRQLFRKQKVPKEFVLTKKILYSILSEILQIRRFFMENENEKFDVRKKRQETEPLASINLLVFLERPLSQKHVVRRQLIRKQKIPTKIVHEKNQFF